MYTAKLTVGGLSIYPQLGIERRSEAYVQHLYGVSAGEAAANGSIRAYQASASIVPNAGVTFLYPLDQRYNLTFQVRKKWLDSSITDSPLVNTKSQITGFVAVTRSFD
jgi:outer membrane protein